jgi:hypothetical protein
MEEKYKNYLNYLEYDEPEKFNDLIDERLDAELLKLYSNL